MAAFRSWCTGTRVVVTATALWLAFVVAHTLLTGRWWLWSIVEVMPPVTLVLVPLGLLAVTPLARPVRRLLAPALVATVLAGLSLSGVDIRGGAQPTSGRAIRVFSWSTDIWHAAKDRAGFYGYLRSKDADVYLLQEYLYWSDGPIRIDDYARLRAEFPGHEMRVEGELITLSRLPIVATHHQPTAAGAQWYWRGSKAQRTDILAFGRVISVYNVHLQVPLRVEQSVLSLEFYRFVRQQYVSRHAELARLREDLARNPHPAVVAGDYNSAWMDSLIPLDRRLIRHDPTTRSVLLATWPTATYTAPRVWRLDWLFTTADIRVHDYRFIRSPSDHAAQEIRLSVKEDEDARGRSI